MSTARATGTEDGGKAGYARFPLALLALLLLICAAAGWAPAAGRLNYMLEVVPGLVVVAGLAALYPRFPMSRLVYVGVFLHVLVLVYGGYWTYAGTPLGNWAREALHLSRNHYDRIGHLALGFFPAFITREVLLRRTPLQRGGWLAFLVCSVCTAIGALWELVEWWTTLLVASDVGDAFLGSQGDIWDAQWDMLLVLVGSVVAVAFFSRLHDRSMNRMERALGGLE